MKIEKKNKINKVKSTFHNSDTNGILSNFMTLSLAQITT